MRSIRNWVLVCVAGTLPALALASESQAAHPDHAKGRRNHGSQSATNTYRTRTTWDSVYSPDQAGRGETTYARTCSRCHQSSLGGADEAPALTGSAFLSAWNGQTLGDLHERVRTTMPTDTPGTYSRQDISDVLAYVLRFNQFPAGKVALPTGDEDLKAITFVSTKP